jgi:ubiquinone/menaquinone biosynthesis C-methylase UbiE
MSLDLQATYRRRFEPDLQFRQGMWQALCAHFFQKYIPVGSRVVEVGAGYCEFINHIQAAEKMAVDLNPEMVTYANPDVRTVLSDTSSIPAISDGWADFAFASNFFEHLDHEHILATLREVRRILKTGGQFIILQPNIRFSYRDYWMFFDHITPIDDRGLAEALEISGFVVTKVIERFLPFTTKSRLPKSTFLVRAYLHFPLIWRWMGRQSLIIAKSTGEPNI